MNFLNPLFLWFLPLSTVPILLHFLHKRPPKRQPFSHVAWIKQAHQTFMPKKKLRDILLMILRSLLILLIALFFSRPVVQQANLFSGDGQRESIMVLLDVSASMGAVTGGHTSLDLAKNFVQDMIRKIPKGARIGFIAYSDKIEKEVTPTDERAVIGTAISNLKLSSRPTDILPALEQAAQMLARQSNSRRSLLIISDQAQNGWRSALEKAGRWEGYDPETRVVLYEVAPLSPNAGISEATLQLSEEGVLKGQGSLHRQGKISKTQVWQLELNGRAVGQGSISASNAAKQNIPLQAQLPEGGFFAGKLHKTPDAAPFDDTYYLAGRIPRGFRLLIVDGESGLAPSDAESYYLRSALESPRDPRLESIRVIRPDALGQESLAAYNVIVLANAHALNGRENDLKKWVQEGGGLFVSAGGQWPHQQRDPLGLIRPKGNFIGKAAIQPPDETAAFLAGVSKVEDFQWDQIQVHQYVRVETDSSAVPILKMANGDPLLLKKQIGNGHVLCLLTTLDRTWTNLAAKPVFAPLMRELISTLADPLREQSSLNGFVGQAFQAALPAGVRNVTVIAPDGSSSAASINKQGTMEWPSPLLPGLYAVRTEREETDFSFAINILELEKEGNLTRLSEKEMRNLFPQTSVQWVAYENKGPEMVISALQGKDLTNMILIFLFLLVVTETILSWPGRWGNGPRLPKEMAAFALMLLLFSAPAASGSGNNFVYAQLKHEGAWDPYPGAHQRILQTIKQMTNIPFSLDRKVISLNDPDLFESPFLLIKGNAELRLSSEEKVRLKQFIDRGGFVLIDDTLAEARGPFAHSVRSLMAELYPDRTFQKLPLDHALFRSFFLLRNVAGRRISEKALYGLDVSGGGGGEERTAVIYCPNDLLGTWMRDNLGQYLLPCEPGGETQRWESMKLTINIIYFSLTGTYKKDAIHQPFIEMKLGS